MNKDKIKQLIADRATKYSSEYSVNGNRGYSNHYPMNIYSLYQLGASEKQLRIFDQDNIQKLELKKNEKLKIDSSNWKDYLGHKKYNKEYFDFFIKEIECFGVKNTVKKYLETLVFGVSSYAFHGMIRLAFAIEMDVKEEYAEALANWAIGYQEIEVQLDRLDLSLSECIDKIHKNINGKKTSGYFMAGSIKNMSKNKDFVESVSLPKDLSTKDLALFSLQYFLTKPDFESLHAITSSHAIRVLTNYLKSDFSKLLEQYYLSIIALYASKGAVDLKKKPQLNPTSYSWDEVKIKASSSLNDHVGKFVYSCYEEFLEYGDARYLDAACAYAFQE